MAQHPQFPQPNRYPYSLGDMPPESPDSISMPGMTRPADVGMRGFGQYASLPGHGQDLMAELQALTGGQSQQGFMGNPAGPMMHKNLRDRYAAPWNPLDLEKRLPAESLFNALDYTAFTAFRGQPPPSEADTVSQSFAGILSDSGYGSLPLQSVGNPSICGDGDQLLEASLVSRLQAMGQDNVSLRDEPRRRESRGQRSALGNTSVKSIACPDCKATLKTNSELRKHQARHSKPFKCHIPNCPKATEGFSTNNDLDRHKRCVHKIRTRDVIIFRCNLEQCRDKPKDWPRQDNFRQHLKRMHNFEVIDLTPFTFRASANPPYAPSEFGASGEADITGPAAGSQPSWPGYDHPDMSAADAVNEVPCYTQTGGMVSNHSQPTTEPKDAASSETAIVQYRAQDHQENPCLEPDTASAHPAVRITLPLSQRGSDSDQEPLLSVDPPTCVSPNVLSHTPSHFSARLRSKETVSDGQYRLHDQARHRAQSEVGESGSTMPDEMDVDDRARDPASDDDLDGSDSEDDAPRDVVTDTQSILLRDAGAQYLKAEEANLKPLPSQLKLGDEASQPLELDDDTHASAVIESLVKKGKLDDILRKFGYSVSESAETKGQKPSATSSVASDSGQIIKCPKCPKTFTRRCEFKKHQKRHAKPYACTFPRCEKTFGSKNDWKRHENSQHFQLEIWRCAEPIADRPGQPECGKVCHRRESLKSHLERDHQIHDLAMLDKKLAECRMGRNFESRFWCGFCQKTIVPTGKGGPAHSERFNHIDDHFNGRGGIPKADIKDWKHVDTDPVDSPASSPGKGRREGSMGNARSDWLHVGLRGSSSRKRAHGGSGEDGAPRAKRLKEGSGKVVFWTCCDCNTYWRKRTTPKCLICPDHVCCDNCSVFEGDGSPEPEVPVQG